MFELGVEQACKVELLAKVIQVLEILLAKMVLLEFLCSFGFSPGERVQIIILGILNEYAARNHRYLPV